MTASYWELRALRAENLVLALGHKLNEALDCLGPKQPAVMHPDGKPRARELIVQVLESIKEKKP